MRAPRYLVELTSEERKENFANYLAAREESERARTKRGAGQWAPTGPGMRQLTQQDVEETQQNIMDYQNGFHDLQSEPKGYKIPHENAWKTRIKLINDDNGLNFNSSIFIESEEEDLSHQYPSVGDDLRNNIQETEHHHTSPLEDELVFNLKDKEHHRRSQLEDDLRYNLQERDQHHRLTLEDELRYDLRNKEYHQRSPVQDFGSHRHRRAATPSQSDYQIETAVFADYDMYKFVSAMDGVTDPVQKITDIIFTIMNGVRFCTLSVNLSCKNLSTYQPL